MQLRDLGRMEYGACLELQRRLRDEVQAGAEDVLLMVEHDPVATLGRRGTPDEVFDKTLPVHTVERGGKATYHGPGQLVLYPIVHLGEGNRDVRAWVVHLETLVVRMLADFGVEAEPRLDNPGVWTKGSGKKIASIGVAIQGWVSFHGLALNVTTDLREFERINPCGLGAAVMTSLAAEGKAVTLDEAKAWVRQHAVAHLSAFRVERKQLA